MNERIRAAILERCFGVISYASYQIHIAGAEYPVPALMSVARAGGDYVLCMGSDASVEFRSLEELQSMMPPFGAEHERGYEDARKPVITRFCEHR